MVKKTAIVVIDMVKDYVDTESHFNMGEEARRIIPNIQRLLAVAREKGFPR